MGKGNGRMWINNAKGKVQPRLRAPIGSPLPSSVKLVFGRNTGEGHAWIFLEEFPPEGIRGIDGINFDKMHMKNE